MLFNSIHFLIFFPIVFFLYYAIPKKYRWVLLLIASYYFYMSWKPEYALLIILSTVVDYWAGLMIGKTEEKKKRKKFLIGSLVVNLGLLFFFKYFNFFSDSAYAIFSSFSLPMDQLHLNVLLPVGISFYTFQTLSYTIDVYRGAISPERHFGIFAVYVSFFPQLVAGPIERAKNLLPQFNTCNDFKYNKAVNGLRLMLWGFFLKVVIADKLALTVDKIYGNVFDFPGPALLIATYFFAFQIYCDFAGYSFIAIGAAKLLGIDLMENFRRPYFSKSIHEFWQRWHISLSTWFRDYLYIPLGGNRVSKQRWYLNLFLVFLISGLWHGANWTFIMWGALHGTYLIVSIITKKHRERFTKAIGLAKHKLLHSLVSMFITFHLALFAWIFFRAATIGEAFYIIMNLFTGWGASFKEFGLPLSMAGLAFILAIIFLMEIVHIVQERYGMVRFLARRPAYVRWGLYVFFLMMILLFGEFGQQEFIYFQF